MSPNRRLSGVAVAVVGRSLHAPVVDAQLLGAVYIVEDGHLLTAHHRDAPDLVRIEPADVNMCGLSAGETQGHEDRIRNARLQVSETLRGHRYRLLLQQNSATEMSCGARLHMAFSLRRTCPRLSRLLYR